MKADQHKFKIGVYGAITLDQARRLAGIELGKVAAGGCPATEKKVDQKKKVNTVEELCVFYFKEDLAGRVLYRGAYQTQNLLNPQTGAGRYF